MNEKIYEILSQVMGVSHGDLNEDSSPDTVENWDSLHHMSLILALEEEFEVQFTDEQVVDMMNVKLILLILEEARETSNP